MHGTAEIKKKLGEIAARSAAFQLRQKTSTAVHDIISSELEKARSIDAEADKTEASIQPLLREEARAHHERAQGVAAQRLFETLADEILERYEQTLRMQEMILDRGGHDTERLMKMSNDRWEWFLHEKRLNYGSKLVAQAIECAAL